MSTILKVPKVICFIMNKGGVGKTTTTLNFVGALSEPRSTGRAFKIGVIDNDPQCNLSDALEREALLEKDEDLPTAADLLNTENEDVPLDEFFTRVPRKSFNDRVFLLPGHPDLETVKDDLEFELKVTSPLPKGQTKDIGGERYSIQGFELKKAALFKKLRERIHTDLAGKLDYILIDTPPSRGFLTQMALGISDYVVPVISPGTKELDGLFSMEELIANVWYAYNPDLEVAGVLVNHVFEREVLATDIRRLVRERYTEIDLVLKHEIPRSVRIAEALSNNITIFESLHPKAEKSKVAYRKVLEELYLRALTQMEGKTVSAKYFFDFVYGQEQEAANE